MFSRILDDLQHLVTGIEADSTRQALHRPGQNGRLRGIVIILIPRGIIIVLRERRLEDDLLLLRQLRFSTKVAIRITRLLLEILNQLDRRCNRAPT